MAARMLLKLHLKGHGVVPGAVSRLTHCTDPPCSYYILYLELCVRGHYLRSISLSKEKSDASAMGQLVCLCLERMVRSPQTFLHENVFVLIGWWQEYQMHAQDTQSRSVSPQKKVTLILFLNHQRPNRLSWNIKTRHSFAICSPSLWYPLLWGRQSQHLQVFAK